jgi:hypothetical protein
MHYLTVCVLALWAAAATSPDGRAGRCARSIPSPGRSFKDTLQKPSAGGDGMVRIGGKARKGWGMKQLSLAPVGFER